MRHQGSMRRDELMIVNPFGSGAMVLVHDGRFYRMQRPNWGSQPRSAKYFRASDGILHKAWSGSTRSQRASSYPSRLGVGPRLVGEDGTLYKIIERTAHRAFHPSGQAWPVGRLTRGDNAGPTRRRYQWQEFRA
jgi:hypothetical protein